MKLQYCLSVMIQNKTLQTLTKQLGLNHLSRYFHWIPHSVSSRFLFFLHIILQTASVLSRHWWHTEPAKFVHTQKKCFKILQNKGNICQVFGGKPPCHVTVNGTGLGFQHRRFCWSWCAAIVAFHLHVIYQCLWHGSKQSPISAWSVERVNHNFSFFCGLTDFFSVHTGWTFFSSSWVKLWILAEKCYKY